jgi:thioredoxin-dependent peroxiredoxin
VRAAYAQSTLDLRGAIDPRRGFAFYPPRFNRTPSKEHTMTIQLGQIAPDFEQDTTQGRIRFHEWLGDSWGVLFSHPKDFTPVCTTELGAVARLAPEWKKRNVKVIGLSVDPADSHKRWETDIADTQGVTVDFPMIADPDRKVSGLYGMVHPEADPSVTVRTVFIIDPNKKVRLSLTYPPSAGRNFNEVLRVIDSLQLTDSRKVTTPADWKPGDDVIIAPSVNDETARGLFPQGWKTLKPYLRMVKLPVG